MRAKVILFISLLTGSLASAQLPSITFGYSGNAGGCAPHTVVFNISGFSGNVSTTTYTVNFGDGSPILNYTQATLPTTISHTYTQISCGQVFNGNQNAFGATITATNASGSTIGAVAPIRISKKPNAAFTLSPPVICSGGSITFTNTSDPGVTYSGTTCNTSPPYYWQITGPSAGTVSSGSLGNNGGFPTDPDAWTSGTSPLTMQFTTPGSYQMKLSIGNSCGIDDTTIQFSVIESSPSVSLGVNGNLTSCAPSSFSFSISNTDNNHASTVYTVTFSDGGPTQTFNHPPPAVVTHTFTQSSCGQTSLNNLPNAFSVQITAQNPCDISQATIEPIRISTAPNAQFTALPDPVCINSTVTVNSTADPGTNVNTSGCNTNHGMVWSISPATGWTLSGGTLGSVNGQPTNYLAWTSGSTQLQLSFSQPGNYTITQRIRNSCGEDVATEVVCVVPPLTANFTLSGSPCATSILSTDNLTTPANTCVPPVYMWSISPVAPFDPNVPPYTSNSFEPEWLLTQEGLYTVNLSATNACGTSTATNNFTIVAPPDVNLAAVPPGCAPYTVDPSVTYSDGGGTITLQQWQINGGAWQTITPAEPVDFPPQVFTAGTHTIKVRIANECGIDSSLVVFNVSDSNNQINVNAGFDEDVCLESGTNLQLEGEPAGGTWFGNANLSASGVFTPSEAGQFICIYSYATPECSLSDTLIVSVSFCLNSQQANTLGNKFMGFYDLSKDNFHLKYLNGDLTKFNIDIINLSGQVIVSSECSSGAGNEWIWNLNDMPHGVYFARISNNTERKMFKFIK